MRYNWRYKVGEKVRVVALDSDGSTMIRELGVVIGIDEEWMNPYEVELENKEKYHKDLFTEGELEPYFTEEKTLGFINIKFQEGNVRDNGVNGAQVEDVIDVLVEQLLEFQKSEFACRENALAITKLEEARLWLNERTRKRKEQGVEGMDKNHE